MASEKFAQMVAAAGTVQANAYSDQVTELVRLIKQQNPTVDEGQMQKVLAAFLNLDFAIKMVKKIEILLAAAKNGTLGIMDILDAVLDIVRTDKPNQDMKVTLFETFNCPIPVPAKKEKEASVA
jgi:hypothetical protein